MLERRRGHGSLLRIMQMYSTRVFDQNRTDRRRWVAWLDPSGTEPRGWPRRTLQGTPHPAWSDYKEAWLRVYEHAGAILRGEVEPSCDAPPDHWGGRFGIDLRRARKAGWHEVDCGPTRNAFWSVTHGRSARTSSHPPALGPSTEGGGG